MFAKVIKLGLVSSFGMTQVAHLASSCERIKYSGSLGNLQVSHISASVIARLECLVELAKETARPKLSAQCRLIIIC